jgi:hypothetical protein
METLADRDIEFISKPCLRNPYFITPWRNSMSELVVHYDQDFCAWVGHQVTLLRQRRFSELDIDNLIEELESLSKAYRQQLINQSSRRVIDASAEMEIRLAQAF